MWPLYVQTAMTDDIKTGTTESLGIRLTAQDVADAIAKAVEPSWLRRAIHQVHFPVGSQTKAMAAGARFSPAWLTRLANKRLARSLTPAEAILRWAALPSRCRCAARCTLGSTVKAPPIQADTPSPRTTRLLRE